MKENPIKTVMAAVLIAAGIAALDCIAVAAAPVTVGLLIGTGIALIAAGVATGLATYFRDSRREEELSKGEETNSEDPTSTQPPVSSEDPVPEELNGGEENDHKPEETIEDADTFITEFIKTLPSENDDENDKDNTLGEAKNPDGKAAESQKLPKDSNVSDSGETSKSEETNSEDQAEDPTSAQPPVSSEDPVSKGLNGGEENDHKPEETIENAPPGEDSGAKNLEVNENSQAPKPEEPQNRSWTGGILGSSLRGLATIVDSFNNLLIGPNVLSGKREVPLGRNTSNRDSDFPNDPNSPEE